MRKPSFIYTLIEETDMRPLGQRNALAIAKFVQNNCRADNSDSAKCRDRTKSLERSRALALSLGSFLILPTPLHSGDGG